MGLAGLIPSGLYITGTLYIAIGLPFVGFFIFSHLQQAKAGPSLHSGSFTGRSLPKNGFARALMLAEGAIMRAAARHQDATDGTLAAAAGLTGALVNAVLQLKEAAHAVGIDVV